MDAWLGLWSHHVSQFCTLIRELFLHCTEPHTSDETPTQPRTYTVAMYGSTYFTCLVFLTLREDFKCFER